MKKDFKVKDHSVTGEEFVLTYDEKLHMYYTMPKPTLGSLPSYYESDDYISHTDGKRSLFEIAYQTVKGITLSRKRKLLKKYHPSLGRVLDIGAGTGDFLEHLSKHNWNTSGIEPSIKAKSLAQKKGLDLKSTIEEVGEEQFDVITMWHVLEHVYDLEFWAAYDVPRHLYHFSEQSIKMLFELSDLKLVEVLPMKFDAFYVSLLSEKYTSGKMNYFKALTTGLRSNKRAKANGGYSSQIYVLKHAKN